MFKKFPLIERKTPVIDLLSKRPTIILDEPLVKKIDPPEVVLPPGVSPEEAVETVARTPWATGWAEGIAKMAGYTPSTPEYHRQVERLSKFVARRLLGVT